MDNNKLTVAVDIDSKEAERKLSELERKIKSMREFGPSGNLSQLAQQYRSSGQDERAKRLEDFRERQSSLNRKQLSRDLKEQESQLEKILKQHQAIQNILDKGLVGGQSKNKILERQSQLLNEISQKTKTIQNIGGAIGGEGNCPPGTKWNPATKTCEPISGIFGRPNGSGSGPFTNALGKIGRFSNVIGAIGAANYGASLYSSITTQEERQATARAQMAGVVGESVQLQSQGRGYEMYYHAEERKKAAEAAKKRQKSTRVMDSTITGGATATTIAGLGMLLAGAGLSLTGVGAPVGAPLMAKGLTTTAVGGTALAGSMMNDRLRSKIFDPEAYEQLLGAKGAKAYQQTLAAYEAENFEKVSARKYFEKNKKSMMQMQRAFGLSDKELFGEGSLYDRASSAGFNKNTIDSSALGILGAGGTTKAGVEGAVYAAQMQRGLDLTNAPALLGRVSGRTGLGGAESKDEVIRLFAEATKIGLNESEVRTLLDTSTSMALQTGVSAVEMQQAMQTGIKVNSGRGIQAAAGAFGRIREKTREMGNTRGQFALAEFGSNEMANILEEAGSKKGGFSFKEAALLSGTDIGKISADNKAIRGLLLDKGIDPDSEEGKKVIKEIKRRSFRSTIKNKERERALERLRIAEEKLKGATSPKERKKLKNERDIAFSKAQQYQFLEEGGSSTELGLMDEESTLSMGGKFLKGIFGSDTKVDTTKTRERMEGKTGRLVDDLEGFSQSKDFAQEVSRLKDNMKELRDSFKESAQDTSLKEFLTMVGRLASAGNLSSDIMEKYYKGIEKRAEEKEIRARGGKILGGIDFIDSLSDNEYKNMSTPKDK